MMEQKKSQPRRHAFDRVYDILTVQLIGAMIFIIIALVVKLIGGAVYEKSRSIYFSATENTTDLSDLQDALHEESNKNNNLTESSLPIPPKEEPVEEEKIKEDVLTPTVVPTAAKPLNQNSLIWPVIGKITSEFGSREAPIAGASTAHSGIDIAAEWDTPITAAADGVVIYTGTSEGYGNYLILSHGSSFSTLYAHCHTLIAQKGQTVRQGDVIALAGNTGRATGSHLHFETIIGGKTVDPRWLLPDGAVV